MEIEEIIQLCLSYSGSYEDLPFGDGWLAIRHQRNKKMFALIYQHEGHLCMNVKCEPERADVYRSIYDDVKPAYHMNKTHWNKVILDGALTEEDIREFISHSYELTKPRNKI